MAQIHTLSPLPMESLSVGESRGIQWYGVGGLQEIPPQARKLPKQGLQAWGEELESSSQPSTVNSILSCLSSTQCLSFPYVACL